jgi:hypothetical protein
MTLMSCPHNLSMVKIHKENKRKVFWKKIHTLQNPHIVFSNKKDYNTLAMQVFIGAHHHNSDSKRLLLEPNLANRTR